LVPFKKRGNIDPLFPSASIAIIKFLRGYKQNVDCLIELTKITTSFLFAQLPENFRTIA
jgi:hypothetical protein